MNRQGKQRIGVACAALMAFMAFDSASAADRIDRIAETKTFVVAYREGGVPFSYLVGKDKPVGMGVDISNRIADALRERTGVHDINIRYQPVTASTRMPMMVANVIDVECGQTTHTLAREAQVSFSNTYYVSEEAIATLNGSSISDYSDLSGLTVGVAANTTTEMAMNERAESQGFKVQPVRSDVVGIKMLTEKTLDAYVAAKPILVGMKATSANPDSIRIVGTGKGLEAFSCMLPKGDGDFKMLVDGVLNSMMQSGEMLGLHDKWFGQPIPPNRVTLGLEANSATLNAYSNPNDLAL